MGVLAALIGFVGKRLAGLEALFVYQMAFLSIVWLNYELYLPFQIVSPLKYSNGYHAQGFISSSSTLSNRLLAATNQIYPYPHTL